MRQDLRTVLDVIDEYLANHQSKSASQTLWSILTALRGPDSGSILEKDATTSVLRAAAFPKTARLSHSEGGRVWASMSNDAQHRANTRSKLPYSEHFHTHIRQAFVALNLKWCEVNTPEVDSYKEDCK